MKFYLVLNDFFKVRPAEWQNFLTMKYIYVSKFITNFQLKTTIIFWMHEIMERLLPHKSSNLWKQMWVQCTQCTECTVHFSLVSGHLLVFHRRCWVVCSLPKVVEADITMHNGLIHISLPIYVHVVHRYVHLFLVGFLSSLRDWLLLPWRQADPNCWWVVRLVLASTQQLTSIKPPKAHFEL